MPAIQPLASMFNIDVSKLPKDKCILLEIELFMRVTDLLVDTLQQIFFSYTRLLKPLDEKEGEMIKQNWVSLILKDILCSQEYTLDGIALYIDTSEDVLEDVLSEKNCYPSLYLTRKIIELHRAVRPELYRAISATIVEACSTLED